MTTVEDPRIIAMLRSYRTFFGAALYSIERLDEAPFVVLAHGLESPPILFYGNHAALELWEMSFEDFTRMPSYKTAEPDCREAREALLEEVARLGYSRGYRGIRVSATGRRFEIRQATVWNIVDDDGRRLGQAATFRDYVPL